MDPDMALSISLGPDHTKTTCGIVGHSDQFGSSHGQVLEHQHGHKFQPRPVWPLVVAWAMDPDPRCGRTTDPDIVLSSNPDPDVTMNPDGNTDHLDWQGLSVNMNFEHQYGHVEDLAPCH